MINQFIISLDRATQLKWYNSFGYVGYAVMIVLLIWAIKAYRFNRKESLAILVSFVMVYLSVPYVCTLLNKWSNGLIPDQNLGVGFLPFMVLYPMLIALLKTRLPAALDIGTLMYIGGRGTLILGCLFAGCCHGRPAEWGIYSYQTNCNTVPCPLFDCIASLLLVTVLVVHRQKENPSSQGKTAAYAMIGFGVIRYVIDQLRVNDKLFELFTMEGIFGFIYVCLGLTLLYWLGKNQTKSIAN